jgi:hypothetical protein
MNGPVDLYVASAPDAVRPLLQAARRFLHESVPGLAEAMKWRMPTFMRGRNLFYLNAQPDHVVLGFSAGASLKEHHAVFDAVKGEVAHVRLRTAADLDRPGLRDAVRAAAGFPPVHAAHDFADRLHERHAPHGTSHDDPKVRA